MPTTLSRQGKSKKPSKFARFFYDKNCCRRTNPITAAPELLVENDYDDLGQLKAKEVGAKTQRIDYSYNIRGWLTEINKVAALQQVNDPKDLFAFKINYNTVSSNIVGVGALYNGNIAETHWATSTDNVVRTYGYSYDALNRLHEALYKKGTVVSNAYNEKLSYDANGNIKTLTRFGSLNDTTPVVIDELTYAYKTASSNQLMKVTDTKANNASFINEFKDSATNGVDDYAYDPNGNMTKDNNKNITDITYNHLNLPKKITFGATGSIEYIYNAAGVKVSKAVYITSTGSIPSRTEYLNGFQYVFRENYNNFVTKLKFFPTAEGYVEPVGSSYKYVYQYKDHLGNIRLSYDKTLAIQEENSYYPFGLKHAGYGAPTPSTNDALKYKYNGKELQDESIGGFQLNWYDYGARNYDPALGRWMNIDPLAELSRRFTPYNYAVNNPVSFVDPDGMLSQSFMDILNNSASGTTWTNNNNGTFSNNNGETVSDGESSDSPPYDITVGANGRVTNVVKNDKPNRFFDENGNQLKANDSSVDNQFLEFEWNVGDQLFSPISITTFFKFIAKAGIMPPSILGLGYRYLSTAYQSHSTADFGYNQLMQAYNESYGGNEYGGNIGNGTFYRFQGTNTLYNLSDAGNFLWGAWMSFNNFSYPEVKYGSKLNSIFTLNGFDTASDQRAIKNGFNYIKK